MGAKGDFPAKICDTCRSQVQRGTEDHKYLICGAPKAVNIHLIRNCHKLIPDDFLRRHVGECSRNFSSSGQRPEESVNTDVGQTSLAFVIDQDIVLE